MPATKKKKFEGFSEYERQAMKARAQELLAESRSKKNKAQGEDNVLQAIAAMPEPDRTIAQRLHTLVKESAPSLSPKTWYGMPAYAKDDKVLCFFQSAGKFKTRYSSLGFNDNANLDEGTIWPTAFAIKKLGTPEEEKIRQLLKQALS